MSYFKNVLEEEKWLVRASMELPREYYEDYIRCYVDNLSKYKNVFKTIPAVCILFRLLCVPLLVILVLTVMLPVIGLVFIPCNCLDKGEVSEGLKSFRKKYVYNGDE